MARQPNTDRNGNSFSQDTIRAVWDKGIYTNSYNHPPDQFRRDKCGELIEYRFYGNRDSTNGWEVDHINPVANGGTDDLSNLQPLYWLNNARKADKLNWVCGQV